MKEKEMIKKTTLVALATTTFAVLSPLMPVGQAFAHSELKSSRPKAGETLSAPKALNLDFDHPTRLTKLRLTSGGKEVPLVMDPSTGTAKSFAIPVPPLVPGEYQVRWSTLGSDGHVMTGNFSFTVTGK